MRLRDDMIELFYVTIPIPTSDDSLTAAVGPRHEGRRPERVWRCASEDRYESAARGAADLIWFMDRHMIGAHCVSFSYCMCLRASVGFRDTPVAFVRAFGVGFVRPFLAFGLLSRCLLLSSDVVVRGQCRVCSQC